MFGANFLDVVYEGSSFEEEHKDLVNAVVGLACMLYLNNDVSTVAITHVTLYRFFLRFLSTCELVYSYDIISHISGCIQVRLMLNRLSIGYRYSTIVNRLTRNYHHDF